MRHKKNSKGVVMIELILGVVILGVIVAMVCAQFAGVLPRLKFKSASTSIVSDLRLARSEAIALKLSLEFISTSEEANIRCLKTKSTFLHLPMTWATP